MTKFGPTKVDLNARLIFGFAGLAVVLGAVAFHGAPKGPAMFEIIGVAAVFFGGTAIWTIRKLIKGDFSDGL
jgi:hypothetical protein